MSTRPPVQPAAPREDIERSIADWFSVNERSVRDVQARHLAARRVHFQGLLTPVVPPDDGAEKDADFTRKPQDKAESLEDVFAGADALSSRLPCSISLDVYGSNKGEGYTLTATYTQGGRRFERVLLHEGPEKHREHDWQETLSPIAREGRV